MDPDGPQLARIVWVYRFENSLDFAGKVLFLYDFLLMLRQEISFIQESKWTPIKFTYLVARYLPFVDIVVYYHFRITADLTKAQCIAAHKATAWTTSIGIVLSEVVLTHRLWVIWDKGRRLKYALHFFCCAMWCASIVPLFLYNTSSTFFNLPQLQGCIFVAESRIVFVDWVLLLLYNTTTLVLMVIRATSSYWSGTNSRLLRKLYRDAIWCYLVLFVVSVISVAFTTSLPVEYADMLSSIIRSLHSNLSTRAVLGFRREAKKLSDQAEITVEGSA